MAPKAVQGLSKIKAAGVAAGNSHAVVVTAEGRVIKFGHGLVTQLDHTDNLRRDKVYPLSPHAKGFEGEGRRLGGDVAEHDKGSDDWDQGPDVRYDPQANFDFTSLQERLAAMDNMSVF